MTQLVRFLFDACLAAGPQVRAQLAASLRLYGANAELVHFFEKFARDAKDAEWIPQIAAEGGWIVISADQGKHGSEKLPKICAAYGVTHVLFSAALAKRNWYYKVLALQTRWEQLLATALSPKGTEFKLSLLGEGSFRLQQVSEPPSRASPQHQPLLFEPPKQP